jgi:ABC-type transport system involved in cytochrome c biogenesis permease subunit
VLRHCSLAILEGTLNMTRIFLLISCCIAAFLQAGPEVIPSAYQGRIRPLEATARLWLYNQSHTQKEALQFAWNLHLKGYEAFSDTPFFWIQHAETKTLLGLDPKKSRFSYNELRQAMIESSQTNLALINELISHHFDQALLSPQNRSGSTRLELNSLSQGLWVAKKGDYAVIAEAPKTIPWHHLKPGMTIKRSSKKATVDELLSLWNSLTSFERYLPIHQVASNSMLQENLSLRQRLLDAGQDFRVLPGRLAPGEWYSLKALDLQVFTDDEIAPVGNFTVFSDMLFDQLRRDYARQDLEALAIHLQEGYAHIAGKPIQKGLTYPSMGQLKAEVFYYRIPLPLIALGFYLIAAMLLVLAATLKSPKLTSAGMGLMITAWLIHTAILVLRCYILARPPVSNMFETVVYVPWIAVLGSFFLPKPFGPLAASILAVVLLSLLEITQLSSGMETLQPVLNSQYWLIIHVLLVVASYGIFLLSGVLGHLYLGLKALGKQNEGQLPKAILHTMYLGTFMLIVGTILGGVWAAESWGRFWDWDPKEAWAFISICIYLLWIHSYTFRRIGNLGLAIGSIVGLWAISFTWYGVNYILGTGLHSYGFGSGGEHFYYLFLFADLLFIVLCTVCVEKKGMLKYS